MATDRSLVEMAPPEAVLAATTPVDIDSGAAYVLQGRVVTMDDDGTVIDDGQVAVSRGRIVAIAPAGTDLPAPMAEAPRHVTGGTIYPGLVDLHNHFVYNVLPLWVVPKRYENRTQWPRNDAYPAQVTLPVRTLAEEPSTARALVRYVEAKALVGGTTTGQGMRTRVDGGPKLFRGAMRNVEETGDPALPEAGTRVPNLFANEEGVRSFRDSLARRTSYLYHLAEGIDASARRTFTDLADNRLLAPSLVGIHCLGLHPDDLAALAAAGAKAVWSPFSNLLLYGRTLDLLALQESGLPFAIGCDWSPTGSKNLLEELKVARWVARSQGSELTDAALVRAVTASAADIVGWGAALGRVVPGAYADLLVTTHRGDDPYTALVDATERDVRLVTVHGVARYGDADLLREVCAEPGALEEVEIAGTAKAFDFQAAGSEINELTWSDAAATLTEAMSDLPGFRSRSEEARLASDRPPEFVVELDNEWQPTPDDLLDLGIPEAALAADWSLLADSVPLDRPEVGGGDYWDAVKAQPNLDPDLAETLEQSYARR